MSFLINGPAIISFSGGRSSAFMLRQILDAHMGALPDDVHVVFANTGKEREETLRFVQDCDDYWGVRVRWVEYRHNGYAEVTRDTASIDGEPFDTLIERKQFLPNSAARFCTQELKVKPIHAFAANLGLSGYTEVVGLRADEPMRYAKMMGRNLDEQRQCIAPLFKAGVTKRDVAAYWAAQNFDLDLLPGEGNCDLCFLKGAGLLRSLMRDHPSRAYWWIDHEQRMDAQFTKRDSYAQMKADALANGELSLGPEEHDVECGLLCGPDE